ncbi:hypothetical protein ACNKHV_15705 [Shigella flexneri]
MRFLEIYSNNLDEFYKVLFTELKQPSLLPRRTRLQLSFPPFTGQN